MVDKLRWEYTTFAFAVNRDEAGDAIDLFRLNQLGEVGWEMVAVHADIAYFKRPAKQR